MKKIYAMRFLALVTIFGIFSHSHAMRKGLSRNAQERIINQKESALIKQCAETLVCLRKFGETEKVRKEYFRAEMAENPNAIDSKKKYYYRIPNVFSVNELAFICNKHYSSPVKIFKDSSDDIYGMGINCDHFSPDFLKNLVNDKNSIALLLLSKLEHGKRFALFNEKLINGTNTYENSFQTLIQQIKALLLLQQNAMSIHQEESIAKKLLNYIKLYQDEYAREAKEVEASFSFSKSDQNFEDNCLKLISNYMQKRSLLINQADAEKIKSNLDILKRASDGLLYKDMVQDVIASYSIDQALDKNTKTTIKTEQKNRPASKNKRKKSRQQRSNNPKNNQKTNKDSAIKKQSTPSSLNNVSSSNVTTQIVVSVSHNNEKENSLSIPKAIQKSPEEKIKELAKKEFDEDIISADDMVITCKNQHGDDCTFFNLGTTSLADLLEQSPLVKIAYHDRVKIWHDKKCVTDRYQAALHSFPKSMLGIFNSWGCDESYVDRNQREIRSRYFLGTLTIVIIHKIIGINQRFDKNT